MNVNAQQNTETISVTAKKKRNPAVARFFSNRLLVRGAILILLSILIAVFAPLISPFVLSINQSITEFDFQHSKNLCLRAISYL